jgi:hypothetical protein
VRLILLLILLLTGPAFSQVRQRVFVRYGDIHEIASVLVTLVPDAHIEVEEYFLVITGGLPAIEQALELLQQLDQEPARVTVECRVVLETSEIDKHCGTDFVGQRYDYKPTVLHWGDPQESGGSFMPFVGYVEDLEYVRHLPGVLSFSKVQAWSGQNLDFGTPPDLVWHLTPNVKHDGYVVTKFMPETMFRKITLDYRMKFGETYVLGGFASAEELGLPGQGPVLLMITSTPGW